MGTRLRPLTLETPKPLLPVLNRPFIEYQLDVLRAHGVREVALCTGYKAREFRKRLGSGSRLGLKLHFLEEPVPMGTGGALKNAEGLLRGRRRGTMLVLNGDVLNNLDVGEFLRFHRKHDAMTSIALTEVMDPTVYGLVKTDRAGRITHFIEKPSPDEVQAPTINAGAYLFEPEVFHLLPVGQNYSLERGLFPTLLERSLGFYAWRSRGYWIDIGTVARYLQVHLDLLGGRTGLKLGKMRETLDGGKLLLGAGATVGEGARFSGDVCIGPRCRIGRGALLKDCVVLEGSVIGENARLEGCVIGARCVIGRQSSVLHPSAIAGGSTLKPFSAL